jgi:hypothetical protein
MQPSNTDNERDNERAHRLLHELANVLAVIQMRADLLIVMATSSESSTPTLVEADVRMLRAVAEHAITIAEQFAVIITGAESRATDGPNA